MDIKQEWKKRFTWIALLVLTPAVLFAGLNFQQLVSVWTVSNETRQLERRAAFAPEGVENPAPLTEDFKAGLSTAFWDFTIINGAGQASNETAWHAAEMEIDHQLTLRHVKDPEFEAESADWHEPSSEQYNNVTLIGGSGFQPTPSSDVVVEFKSRVDENFYGTAGVVLQPQGTLQADGLFAKPFDMFGFSVIGNESSFNGANGSVCYLALNWAPVQVEAMNVDPEVWHIYQIRLHQVSRIEWMGTVSVDGSELCRMTMPAFGPVEIQVWSDNYLVSTQPQGWWQIASVLELGFQDGGNKEFHLDDIRIFGEVRE
ncbi:MAG TPA: hypothetical protein PK152_05035 [Anaerolineales bacterium]|nr:hypothetical protein [Anaerolineae bacterium]HRJ57657.1 hypothetical protein [Anaerolineales bacterium]HRK88476.1 hypothetical protein [Anaerolineales bacterium]